MSNPVCITGATGFIGSHVAIAFLEAGIPVHAAVRHPDDDAKTAPLRAAEKRTGTRIRFFEADLGTPKSFDWAVDKCDAVVHVAAVARLTAPDPQGQIVDPAVEGARNVLGSASRARVRRVVLTSSVAAVGSYRDGASRALTEADWNDGATLKSDPYGLAKTTAERLAWQMSEPASWDLVVLNPGLVLGPPLAPRHAKASPVVVRNLLGGIAAIPDISFPVVDVRDVAAAHVRAVTDPNARGRHILASEVWSMRQMTEHLRAAYPSRQFTTKDVSNFMVWLNSFVDKRTSRATLKDVLSHKPAFDGSHAERALGVRYTDIGTSIHDTAQALIDNDWLA